MDGSIIIISKECIISPKFLQKALVWLSNSNGEFLQHTLSNFDDRFLVIVMVNCDEFLEHTLSNCEGGLR